MANKKQERLRLVDQAAQSAHDIVTQLHERAAQVEDGLRTAASNVTGGSEEGTTIQLTDIEGTVQSLVDYVEENPFAAAAMALGAGMMVTNMYWDQFAAMRGRSRASGRKPRAPVRTARPARPAAAKARTAPKAKARKAKVRKAKPTKAKARPK